MNLVERAVRNAKRADNATEDMIKGKIDWDEANQIFKGCTATSRAITTALRAQGRGRRGIGKKK